MYLLRMDENARLILLQGICLYLTKLWKIFMKRKIQIDLKILKNGSNDRGRMLRLFGIEVILRRIYAIRVGCQKTNTSLIENQERTDHKLETGIAPRNNRHREPVHVFGKSFVATVLEALGSRQITITKATPIPRQHQFDERSYVPKGLVNRI